MDLIIWRESFNTGNKRIDNQHKYLVKLINDLFNTLGAVNPENKLKKILSELYNYTVEHFSLEELIMREFGYSDYQKHKEEHFQFAMKLSDFKKRFLNGDTNINMEILNFMKEWLLNHILENDRILFAEIQKNSSK